MPTPSVRVQVDTLSELRNKRIDQDTSLKKHKFFLFLIFTTIVGLFLIDQLSFFFLLSQSLSKSLILFLNFVFNAGVAILVFLVVIKITKSISDNYQKNLNELIKSKLSLEYELSNRSKSEDEIKQAKKEWEKTFDSMFDWVSIIDQNHTILQSNRGSEKIVDALPENIIGKKCCGVLHGTDGPVDGCPLPEVIAKRQRVSTEIVSLKGRWVMISIDPVIGDDGDVINAVHIVRDISTRKAYEIEREKLISKLEEANREIKTLSGLLPICSICKKIRNDIGNWDQIETFIQQRSEAHFSHSLCPDCIKNRYPDLKLDEEV